MFSEGLSFFHSFILTRACLLSPLWDFTLFNECFRCLLFRQPFENVSREKELLLGINYIFKVKHIFH